MKADETLDLPMVCGRSIQGNPIYFPQAEYQGRPVYFCTEFCRNAFETEPERFYTAHRRLPKSEQEE